MTTGNRDAENQRLSAVLIKYRTVLNSIDGVCAAATGGCRSTKEKEMNDVMMMKVDLYDFAEQQKQLMLEMNTLFAGMY